MAANYLSGDEPIEVHFYYHYDCLGSVVALSDSSGRTVEKYDYDVYGAVMIRAASGEPRETTSYDNSYFFTGRRLDSETSLYYYRARMYSYQLGRFLQTDPIGYADGINWYLYCDNNPLVWVDPWGLCGEEPGSMFLYGGSISGGGMWGGTFGVQNIAGTDKAFVHTGGGGYGGFGISATVDLSYAYGKQSDLDGVFATSGGSLTVPYPISAATGGPYTVGLETNTGEALGGTLSVGVAKAVAPAEIHVFVERGWVMKRSEVVSFVGQNLISRNRMINDLVENGLEADIFGRRQAP